jgi:hypothetical protein
MGGWEHLPDFSSDDGRRTSGVKTNTSVKNGRLGPTAGHSVAASKVRKQKAVLFVSIRTPFFSPVARRSTPYESIIKGSPASISLYRLPTSSPVFP